MRSHSPEDKIKSCRRSALSAFIRHNSKNWLPTRVFKPCRRRKIFVSKKIATLLVAMIGLRSSFLDLRQFITEYLNKLRVSTSVKLVCGQKLGRTEI